MTAANRGYTAKAKAIKRDSPNKVWISPLRANWIKTPALSTWLMVVDVRKLLIDFWRRFFASKAASFFILAAPPNGEKELELLLISFASASASASAPVGCLSEDVGSGWSWSPQMSGGLPSIERLYTLSSMALAWTSDIRILLPTIKFLEFLVNLWPNTH